MQSSRTILLCVVLFSVLCGGLGTCSALPSIVGLQHSVMTNEYSRMAPFEQGELVGRVLGGPCSGIVCGLMVGGIVGVVVSKLRG